LKGRKLKETDVANEVSIAELMKHTAYLAQADRESASPGEARAIDYFRKFMEELNLDVKIFEIENYISLPVRASIKVLSPLEKELAGLTPSFSASTPPEGLEADLLRLSEDLTAADMRGKIVLGEGLAMPTASWKLEQSGAAGQIWINWGDLPNNSIVSTIWGHPTPDTQHRLPKTPVASIGRREGQILKDLCAKGSVRVRLKTELKTDFMKVPLATAEIKGSVEPDKYVLFNGHVDSWHKGASDNGTANACILEAARIIAKYRDHLRRGVRFVWWSGHSQGRYSGSTWYADYHWDDLHRNAIVHLNVDSLGCQGATDYSEVECTAECYELGSTMIERFTGQKPKYDRIGHSGDNSFWGIGLPTLFQLLSHQPPDPANKKVIVKGLAWFWHTAADTIDKIDQDILLTDVRIYTAVLWRLCTDPVLPMNFVAVADELITLIQDLQQKAAAGFDLTPAMERANRFKESTLSLRRRAMEINDGVDQGKRHIEAAAKNLNRCLMKLSRILMPVNYTLAGPYDFDPAEAIPPLPGLQPAAKLAGLDPNDKPFKFLARKMVRERNRLCHALDEAHELIEETLSRIA
jgi:hypothetical protein